MIDSTGGPVAAHHPDEPCPDWCAYACASTRRNGGFEYAPDLGFAVRSHESRRPTSGERFHVYAVAHEGRDMDGQLHPVGQVRVVADVDDEWADSLDSGLTPDEARRFAKVLLDTADEAERIDAARRGA